MSAVSSTNFFAGTLPRPGLSRAVLFSLLLHLLIVVALHQSSWHEPSLSPAASPLRIELRESAPAAAVVGEQPVMEVKPPAAARTAPPETTATESTTARNDGSTATPTASAAEPTTDPPTMAPALTVQQLRQQAIDAARSQPQRRLGEPAPATLPNNWTRDALPGKATAVPEYLEPLNYTGPTGSQQWQQEDGQIRSETVLADGTVICGRGLTLQPNTSFQTTVIMSSVCGKKNGSERVNRNALSRFHPGNVDSVRDAANADSGQAELAPEDD